VAVAAATDATVSVSNGEIVLHGSDGGDDVIVEASDATGTSWIVSDFGPPALDPGAGCAARSQQSVICDGPVADIVADLDSGNDFMSDDTFFNPGTLPQIVHGGPGSDRLDGSGSDDQLFGEAGDDSFVPHDPTSADLYSGGAGRDRLIYKVSGWSGGVSVTADGTPNDGHAGEKDNVGADIEIVRGTGFDDVISIPKGDLYGVDGNDELSLTSAGGRIYGGDGTDTLNAGPGRALLFGGRGPDTLNSSNGVPNSDDCGGRADVANVDAVDTTVNCETVNGP
jgi:Ca2+-binding RTX toxin-like protein